MSSNPYSRKLEDTSLDISMIPPVGDSRIGAVGNLLGMDDDSDASSEELEQFAMQGNPTARGALVPQFHETTDEDESEEMERFDAPLQQAPPPASSMWQRIQQQEQPAPLPSTSTNVFAPTAAKGNLFRADSGPTRSIVQPTHEAPAPAPTTHSAADDDDEFGYAFEGGSRTGTTHVKTFKPCPAPVHLITNVKDAKLDILEEADEEEEGEADDSRQFSPKTQAQAKRLSHEHWVPVAAPDPGTEEAAVWEAAVRQIETGRPHSGHGESVAGPDEMPLSLDDFNLDIQSDSDAEFTPFHEVDPSILVAAEAPPPDAIIQPRPRDDTFSYAAPELDDAHTHTHTHRQQQGDMYDPWSGGGGETHVAAAAPTPSYTAAPVPAPTFADKQVMGVVDMNRGGFYSDNAQQVSPPHAHRTHTDAAQLQPVPLHPGEEDEEEGGDEYSFLNDHSMAQPPPQQQPQGGVEHQGSGSMGTLVTETSLPYESEPAWSAVPPSLRPNEVSPIREPPPPTGSYAEDEEEVVVDDMGITMDLGDTFAAEEEYTPHLVPPPHAQHHQQQAPPPPIKPALLTQQLQARHRPSEDDEWGAAMRQREVEAVAQQQQAQVPFKPTPVVRVDDAIRRLGRYDYSAVKGSVVVEEKQSGGFMSKIFCCMGASSTPLASQALVNERLLVFCLARTPLDNSDPLHIELLEAVYRRYTGWPEARPIARFGPHWDDVGFQGNDPATDLRGAGMLGLLQFLALWENHPDSAQGPLMALSRDPVHNFPLAIVSINVTRWALEAARAGRLNKDANGCGSYVKALNAFHAGAMYTFYRRWRESGMDMTQSGFFLRDLERWAVGNPAACIAECKNFIAKGQQGQGQRGGSGGNAGRPQQVPHPHHHGDDLELSNLNDLMHSDRAAGGGRPVPVHGGGGSGRQPQQYYNQAAVSGGHADPRSNKFKYAYR